MNLFKEPTNRDILASDDYAIERDKRQKEANWGFEDYIADRKEFKKTDKEKEILYTLKMAWREKIRGMGYSKRKIPKSLYTTIH